jgi:hypothetical protein
MAQRNRSRLAVLAILVLTAATACGPCASLSGFRVALPDRPIEISEDAAQRFQEKIIGGWEARETGQFRLQFTDQELTSYLNLRLGDMRFIPLSEPRIWLTRGDIYVSGNLKAGSLPISGRVGLVLSPQVLDGVAQLSVERASIGPAPIPRAILETLEETMNTSLRQAQMNVHIERLQILEGEAIVIAGAE